ncbi:hypothetical protein QQF73_15205 [Marinobacter sp. M216]|uniref:Uncharacterized protein n=1 Tax=Marinobacter albus TaxID=3030833 RepID=A0ABT7HHF7_9GAMM|nr:MULTISPECIES: hypothetical protein [unclassified Marinobacter]MBW7472431.1 hypothetical protein [Marinobacter sp. F4218]MDK9558981.1 hypothetical protein [Marinobacter sp. M216]
MSLLTSLIRASSQFQQAMEKRPTSDSAAQGGPAKADSPAPQPVGGPGDDRFTPSGDDGKDLANLKSRKLAMADYKQSVGQDLAFVRETLRHKLAEYSLAPNTALNVNRGESGKIQVSGQITEESKTLIENDLNINRNFKDAFSRLSVNEPTLHFMDNALKLNQAYGVNNPLLDTLISENQQFNGLQDLVHRYDTLRRSASAEKMEAAGNSRGYAFNLNARA